MSQEFGYLTMEQIKFAVVLDRLKKFENNQTHAANSLKITRTTLIKALADFEKKDAKTKEIIKANQDLLQRGGLQDRDAFQHDVDSGMSVPVPLKPVPGAGTVLLTAKPAEGSPVVDAAMEANNVMKPPVRLISRLKLAGGDKSKSPLGLETESEREHKRFSKLDKTPISSTLNLNHKFVDAEAKKAKKKKKKAKKARAHAGTR